MKCIVSLSHLNITFRSPSPLKGVYISVNSEFDSLYLLLTFTFSDKKKVSKKYEISLSRCRKVGEFGLFFLPIDLCDVVSCEIRGKNNWNDENDLRFPIISLDFVEEKYTDPYSHSVVFDTREIVTSEILRKCIQDKRNVNKESIVIHTHVFDPAFATNLFDSFLVEAINSSKQFYRIHIIAHSVEYDLPVDHIEGENDKHLVDHITEVFKKDLKDDRVLLIELPRGIVIHKSNLNPEIQVFDYHKAVKEVDEEISSSGFSFDTFESKLQDSKQFGLDLLYRGMISKNIAAVDFSRDTEPESPHILPEFSIAYQSKYCHDICSTFNLRNIKYNNLYNSMRLIDYAAHYGDVLVLRELVRHPNYPDYKDGSLNSIIEIAIMSPLHYSPEIIAGLLKLPVSDPQPKNMEEFIKEYKISSFTDSEKEELRKKQKQSLIAFGKMKKFIFNEYKISLWHTDSGEIYKKLIEIAQKYSKKICLCEGGSNTRGFLQYSELLLNF
ncbi:hypothetical protein ADUPG1_000497 [Aduncisulcus paluster]|uniref:Uncharacterized protein n=1 Tax=Aduncisulcus paluster TaxID=2918883 RepID=A0ABQ5K6K1_9EUKA|nr:hypothetical protein ADUPG1_000497 [Aduncisulcus paluster]